MQIIAAITYYPATIMTIICGYLATVSDPTDEIVIEERRCRLKGEPFDSNRYDYQCNFCETSVARESKHCRECDRCVMDFDHHCKWVNNCVAKKNYKNFIILLISLTISTMAFSINGIIFLVDFYSEVLGVIIISGGSRTGSPEQWKGAVIIVCVVVMSIFAVLLMRLLSFHLFLIRRNITTYEYLMEIKAKSDNPMRIKSKGGKELKNKKKIIPAETPQSNQEDEDKTAFRLDVDSDNNGLTAEQLIKVAKLKKLAMNFQNTGGIENGNESVGIEQVLQQHQSSEDFELMQHLSLKSPASPSNSDYNKPSSPHSPGIYKLKLPIAPSVPEKRLKEVLTGELPPLRHKHRVLRKAMIVETINGDQTTMSVLQDISGRKKTDILKSLAKEGTMSTTEKEKGETSEIRIKLPTTIWKENLIESRKESE